VPKPGPKSAESFVTVIPAVFPQRSEPPDDLPPEQARQWWEKRIPSDAINAAAEVLLASPFGQFSLGLAQDCAEEMLRAAANAVHDRK
jgi:hypothetical protein